MSRLPERVLGLVGVVLMTTGWTGFLTTVPLSELQGIDNDAEGLSVVLVWVQGVVLVLMAVVLAAVRRRPRPGGPGAAAWPWGPAPTGAGLLLLVATAVVLGPVAALGLLVVGGVALAVRERRRAPGAVGAAVPWLETSVLVVMVVVGGYGVVVAAPGTVASSVELLVASAGLVAPGGLTAPPSPRLGLWGAPAVLAACWAVLLVVHLSARGRRGTSTAPVVT